MKPNDLTSNRILYFDYLEVLAIFLVVSIHRSWFDLSYSPFSYLPLNQPDTAEYILQIGYLELSVWFHEFRSCTNCPYVVYQYLIIFVYSFSTAQNMLES